MVSSSAATLNIVSSIERVVGGFIGFAGQYHLFFLESWDEMLLLGIVGTVIVFSYVFQGH